MLKAAERLGVRRVVLTSSTAAIGMPAWAGPALDEDSTFDARFLSIPYMETKRAAERIALNFTGLEVVVVNPTTIYGAGDVNLNTGAVFRRIKKGRMAVCPPGGTSVVSVDDCVEGHLLALEHGRPGRRYILATSSHSYMEIFTAIAASLGVRAPRGVLPRSTYGLARSASWIVEQAAALLRLPVPALDLTTVAFSDRFFEATRARTELGWAPVQDLQGMVEEATEFYLKHALL